MQVEIERSRFHFAVDVWLYEQRDGGVHVYTADGGVRWVSAESGERGEPTFRVSEDVREALSAALLGQSMPTDSMARHLKDAIEVRDRLLTLVEGFETPPRVIDFAPRMTGPA